LFNSSVCLLAIFSSYDLNIARPAAFSAAVQSSDEIEPARRQLRSCGRIPWVGIGIGVHVTMGLGAAEKMANHRTNIERGLVAPNEIVARAPAS
jgi:hypothetical protein